MANRGTKGLYLVGRLGLGHGATFFDGAGAPTNGTSGTGAGKTGPGSLYVDVTNSVVYLNSNTKASPTWTQVTLGGTGTPLVSKVALGHSDVAGGIFKWQAPAPCFFRELLVDVTTKSTGACTADFGPAANGTTLNATMLDGIDVGTAIGTFSSRDATNGADTAAYTDAVLTFKKMATGDWITGSMASGASAGLVGSAYVFYTLA